jgi:hypothetical protein
LAKRPIRVALALAEDEVDLRNWARRLVETLLRLERPASHDEEAA